ncbi:MAG: hypothetical protein Q9207_001304 [Kuettlingeria erythrocarpa]
MATKRYTRAELEHLRASPLVAKPVTLPPVEEWMGPPPDPNQKKTPNRGKNEEALATDVANRRPMFERRMSRVPDDIVLGPPKTAFASAAGARHQTRTLDGVQSSDTTRGDRQNFKDRYSRQGQRHDPDIDDAQDSRPGTQQHRRVTNDGEPWSSRPSRFSGQDEGDRGPRRNGHREQDRDRENVSDSRAPRGFENHRRDANETNDNRRNGQGRGRNEPSWYREEKDGEMAENRRDTTKMREWRDNRSSKETNLDGNRQTKQELDPEWMDEPDVHEKKQAHTQEDFERWKERMKAGNAPAQENAPPSGDQHKGHERTISGMVSPAGKAKVETPLVVDSSIDGFFGLWADPGKKATSNDEQQTRTEATKAKAAKSSKFTGFFGAKALPSEREAESPATNPFAAPADSSSEDKEGFQRILKLLDQQQSNPAKEALPREPIYRRNMPASPGAPRQQQDTSNLQSLSSPRAMNGASLPPNKDSEFLLNLMRQSRPQLAQTSSGDSRQSNTIPPELLPFRNLLVSSPPGLANTLTRAEEPKPFDKLNPTPTPDRNKGPPPGLFDSQRPGPHDSQRMGKEGPEFAPSYITQHVPPQRQSMMAPPGFQAPLRNPSQFPPGLMASIPSATIPDRGNPFGGMRANLHLPPGMAPPGFMHAPPPGFAPMQQPLSQYFGGPPRPPGEGFGEVGDFGLGQAPFGRRQD